MVQSVFISEWYTVFFYSWLFIYMVYNPPNIPGFESLPNSFSGSEKHAFKCCTFVVYPKANQPLEAGLLLALHIQKAVYFSPNSFSQLPE